jgi:2-dehydropantoate 2-reductase
MRIAVMGAGAVGGYFGAKLAAAGHEVVFLARGKHLEAMRRDGLRIESAGCAQCIREAQFTDQPGIAGVVDLVLFCVKSYDTEAAAQSMAPLIGTETTILSLQNGIDNPARIAGRYGPARTLAGVVYIGAQLRAPGVIVHSSGGKIVFGALDGKPSVREKALEQTLNLAGIPCALRSDIVKLQWAKLLWNAPFCAISCLARADVQQILQSTRLKKLALDCMAEVRQAALTRAIELPLSLFDETIAFSAGLGSFKPSMLQDFEAGKPLEYEALNGIIVNLLQHAGKPAPINQAFYALLQHLDKSSREEAAHRQ